MQKYNEILLVILIWICQFQIMQFKSVFAKTAQYKKIKSDSKLNGNIISTHEQVTLQKCAVFGIQNQTSPAYNFYKPSLDTRKGTCEVLGDSRASATLVPANGYTYYELYKVTPDLCTPNPCHHTGQCKNIDTDFGPDFNCTCPFPLGGKNCSDLACETCGRKNDLVVFWDTTKTTSWIQSYDYCRSRGWTLYLDKSKEKHDFAVEIAKKAVPNIKTQVCFWIGMNKTGGVYKHIDGTDLSSFTAWSTNRPTQANCVEIANTAEFLWRWDDEDCAPGGSWKYYPLCEKNYTFLLQ